MIQRILKFIKLLAESNSKKSFIVFALLFSVFGVFDFILSMAIVPIIGVMTGQVESFDKFPLMNQIRNNPINFSYILLSLYFMRVILNLYLLKKISSFSYHVSTSILIKSFERSIKLKLDDFYKLNFSDFLSFVVDTLGQVSTCVRSFLNLIKEMILAFIILIFLIFSLSNSTLLLIFIIICFGAIVVLFSNIIIRNASDEYLILNKERYSAVKYSVENNLFFKILTDFSYPLNMIKVNTQRIAKNRINLELISNIPKNFYENIGLIFVLLLYIFNKGSSDPEVLYELSILGISFYKLVPSLLRVSQSLSSISIAETYINNLKRLEKLSIEEFGEKELSSFKYCRFEDVSYKIGEFKLKVPNLKISKKDKVCLIGPSGSGKSTFLKLFTMLCENDEGKITINGTEATRSYLGSYRRKIAYVTQANYLFPGTIVENIVFGRKIDEDRLKKVLDICMISEFNSDPFNFKLIDLGNNISGGQKQRIALARALYSDFDILILDEATSALDSELEVKVLTKLIKCYEEKTIVAITHNLAVVQYFDQVIRFQNGKIVEN